MKWHEDMKMYCVVGMSLLASACKFWLFSNRHVIMSDLCTSLLFHMNEFMCEYMCLFHINICTEFCVYSSVSIACVYSLHHLITLFACAADAFDRCEHWFCLLAQLRSLCVDVCVCQMSTESCVCLFVCPCPTPGPLSGCGFPFPVPVSHLGPNSDDICSVFVVDLDKGPYGLGMGLIDGLVSHCSMPITITYLFQNLDSVLQHMEKCLLHFCKA